MLEIPKSFNSIFIALFAALITLVAMSVANAVHMMLHDTRRKRMAKQCLALGGHHWDKKEDGRLICLRCHTTFYMRVL